jgi:hypothetical protein
VWEILSKLLHEWFGSPRRGMASVVLALAALFGIARLRREFPADNFVRVCLLAFLLAASGLLTYLLEHIWNALSTKRRETKRRRKIIERLADLTPEGQHTLRNYVEQERKTINFAPFEGVVELLAKDGILVLLAQNSNPNVLCSEIYAIDRTAWEHLSAHPELVHLERRL